MTRQVLTLLRALNAAFTSGDSAGAARARADLSGAIDV